VTNAAIGTAPQVSANGDDTNIDLKVDAKGTGVVKVQGAVPQKYFALFNFIESGCVITADSVGVNKNYSMTAGVVWIGGKRLTVAAVVAATVGASQDRYIDLKDNNDGTASITNTEVANNTTSPALAASGTVDDTVRAGIVTAGATTIAATSSINQGQEDRILPIVSSVAYSVCDGLGNLICPRDPHRKLLGYRQVISGTPSSSGASATLITGLTLPVIIPTGRKVKVSELLPKTQHTTGAICTVGANIWDGTVGSGTQIGGQSESHDSANILYNHFNIESVITPGATTKTYNGAFQVDAGTEQVVVGATTPAWLKVELE
jgi:hypothetical protein